MRARAFIPFFESNEKKERKKAMNQETVLSAHPVEPQVREQVLQCLRDLEAKHDVKVLFAGTAQMLRADGNRDPAEWRRYAGLVANALRA